MLCDTYLSWPLILFCELRCRRSLSCLYPQLVVIKCLVPFSCILAKGDLKDEEEVSKAQLGAFFSAMTIRANAFPEATQWSEGERRAMNTFWPLLMRALPPDVIFIADPEGSIMGGGGSIGPHYSGNDPREMRLVGALREVLAGGHLGYEEVQGVLRDVLPLQVDNKAPGVSESLLSAFLIGQRMNRETDRELKAYCLAFDDEFGMCLIFNTDF